MCPMPNHQSLRMRQTTHRLCINSVIVRVCLVSAPVLNFTGRFPAENKTSGVHYQQIILPRVVNSCCVADSQLGKPPRVVKFLKELWASNPIFSYWKAPEFSGHMWFSLDDWRFYSWQAIYCHGNWKKTWRSPQLEKILRLVKWKGNLNTPQWLYGELRVAFTDNFQPQSPHCTWEPQPNERRGLWSTHLRCALWWRGFRSSLSIWRRAEHPGILPEVWFRGHQRCTEWSWSVGFSYIFPDLCVDCQESIKDVWKFLNVIYGFQRHSKDPLSDWNGFSVGLFSFLFLTCFQGILAHKGMVGEDSLFSEQFVKNRLNPKVYSVFSLLLGKNELVCNHDRCGFFRPTIWEVDGTRIPRSEANL